MSRIVELGGSLPGRRALANRVLPLTVFTALLLVTSIAQGEGLPSALPLTCETALALSAAPEHLREGAGVYVWEGKSYRRARESGNGFDCIVNRDDPYSIKPTCFDAEGSRKIVPKILFVGERLARGASPAEVRKEVAAGFDAGRFERTERAGVAYMLSHYNRPYDPSTKRLHLFPPHVMFYAPDLTNRDIGFSPDTYSSEPLLPFVGYQGPHGYMIVRSGEAAEPADHPLEGCPEWLVTGEVSEIAEATK